MSRAAPPPAPRIVLARHGQTEWSATGRHTGRTDVPLDDVGRKQAADLGPGLARFDFDLVLTSPLARAFDTLRLAAPGLTSATDDDLQEWDYGDYEGITTTEIRREVPDWTVWTHPCPGGETAAEVAARADAVLRRSRGVDGDVLLVAHGHFLRVLAARWLGLDGTAGRLFLLDPATLSVLDHEHGVAGLGRWNAPVA